MGARGSLEEPLDRNEAGPSSSSSNLPSPVSVKSEYKSYKVNSPEFVDSRYKAYNNEKPKEEKKKKKGPRRSTGN